MRLEDGIVYWERRIAHKCARKIRPKKVNLRDAFASLGSIADVRASLYTLNRILEDLRAGRNCVP
jgi:hypothetical protein